MEDVVTDWYASGQIIAVACTPPRVSLISIQNGKQEATFDVSPRNARKWNENDYINGLWWFKTYKEQDRTAMPDLFRRDGIIVRAILLFIMKAFDTCNSIQLIARLSVVYPKNVAAAQSFAGRHLAIKVSQPHMRIGGGHLH